MSEKAVITNQAKALIGDVLNKASDKGFGVKSSGLVIASGVIEVIEHDLLAVIVL